MIDRTRCAWVLAAALAASLTFVDRASAFEHLMHVDEVMLSTGGDRGAQYIELFDAFAETFPGAPYRLDALDAAGVVVGTVNLGTPTSGSRILISSAAADAALGTRGDHALTFALPVDGQACFVNSGGSRIHCVAWGCVTAPASLADSAPSPPDGVSIQRQAVGGEWHLAAPTAGAANVAGTTAVACPGPTVDAGPMERDAGPTDSDAGPTDSDGGPMGTDAGPTGSDAGSMGADGGPMGTDAGTTDGGGGCSVGPDDSPNGARGGLLLLGLLGALIWRRRRYARAPRERAL